tara:strand:+ start:224 stop:469 length:246 start_codon:yes stop_codon:yes gene_type:complete
MQDGDFDMMHLMGGMPSEALDRLTTTRRQQGSLNPEVEEMLAMVGVYWDEISEEYFSVDAVLSNIENETIIKYSNTVDLDH